MKRMILSLALIGMCSLHAALADPELRGTRAELTKLLNTPNTVRIVGESEVKVLADRARLSVKLTVTANELGDALRSLQQLRARFTSTLNTQGIAPDAILGGKFSFTQKSAMFSDKAKSHTVNDLLKVSVKTEKEFQAVADAIDRFPEAQYLGAEFERSDKDEIQARAVKNACNKASARKAAFEENLGLRLTPRSFTEPALADTGFENFAARRGLTRGATDNLVSSGYSAVNTTLEQADDQSGFGEMTFKARVMVEYSAEPK